MTLIDYRPAAPPLKEGSNAERDCASICRSTVSDINLSAPVRDYLHNLRFGEVQCHQHISIIPLYYDAAEDAPRYVALADAIEDGTLSVTEISELGSVPQVLVFNDSHEPVLIIDGEELIGAKQDRILNTSVLVKERSWAVLPVSCTEQRRWAYTSAEFALSSAVLERKIRSRKTRAVSQSLKHNATPSCDQGELWQGIMRLYGKANFLSPTLALHQLVKAQAARLNRCLEDFPRREGQVGLVVLIGGVAVGLEVISRPKVYATLHKRLGRSYALDALLGQPTPAQPATEPYGLAEAFISSLAASHEEIFAAVGYGRDHRYCASGLTGNALVHADHLIHAVFLRLDEARAASV